MCENKQGRNNADRLPRGDAIRSIFRRGIATLLLLLIVSGSLNSQNFRGQQAEIFVYNVIINGIIGGIGGGINKADDEKFMKAFARNFGRGCFGGLVKYSAKRQTYQLRYEHYQPLAAFNRLYFFLGHSMVQNASLNHKLVRAYYFNLYGVNFVLRPGAAGPDRFNARLSLASVASAAWFISQGSRLDPAKSLLYGQFYFSLPPGSYYSGKFVYGRGYYNAIAIAERRSGGYHTAVVPHELVHVYQIYDHFPISSVYTLPLTKKLSQYRWYTFLSRYIDADHEVIFMSLLYYLQPRPLYFRNYYEYEAEHFSTRNAVFR